MSKAYIVDTATTGLIEPIQPIEMAWLELTEDYKVYDSFLRRYRPSKSIELGALATSHIMDEDLIDQISYTQAEHDLPKDITYMIGHNIDYDWKVLGESNVKRICTKALSQHLWPGLDSYSQSALIYYRYRSIATDLLKNAHNALDNVYSNLNLLTEIIKEVGQISFEELWELSELARVPKTISFGKFKGKPYTALDYGYIQWWLTKSDTPPNEYQLKALRAAGWTV